MKEALKKDLEHVRALVNEIYYATCNNEPPWFVNKLTTIELLLIELIKGE